MLMSFRRYPAFALPLLALAGCFLFSCHSLQAQQEQDKTIHLFNGKNLDGWQVHGTEKWYVDNDGTLVCESGPDKEYGYLATDSSFKDFVLTLEFKQEANGN